MTDTTLTRRFFKEYRRLWKLYDLCYSKESNDLYDSLHDNILFQLDGYNEHADGGAEVFECDIKEIKQLNDEIESFWNASNNLEQPNWIFG